MADRSATPESLVDDEIVDAPDAVTTEEVLEDETETTATALRKSRRVVEVEDEEEADELTSDVSEDALSYILRHSRM